MEVCSVLNSIQKNKSKMKRQNFYLSLSFFQSIYIDMFFLVTRLPPFKRDQIKYLVFDVSNVSKERVPTNCDSQSHAKLFRQDDFTGLIIAKYGIGAQLPCSLTFSLIVYRKGKDCGSPTDNRRRWLDSRRVPCHQVVALVKRKLASF